MSFSLFKKGSLRRTFIVNLISGIRLMGPLVAILLVLQMISHWMNQLLNYLPEKLNPYTYFPHAPGIGLIVLIILLVVLGWLTRHFTDSWLLRIVDKLISSIPVLSGLYKAFRRLTDVLLRNPSREFRQVVLLPFPKEGMYTIGFVTGYTIAVLQPVNPEKFVNVFVPTSPNPTSGFYLQVLKEDLVELDISVEDALRTIVSAGSVNPTRKKRRKRSLPKQSKPYHEQSKEETTHDT